MIRLSVFLFFFIQLAILLKARRYAVLGRIAGWGACLFFVGLYIFQVEENSEIVFLITAALIGFSMLFAEIVAYLILKSRK